ncbi:MAG: DUF411 domain-containing protein [Magnetococcales bacterium]|nr:DUF411 domain-containing protein [Magnetococcales bacterium]
MAALVVMVGGLTFSAELMAEEQGEVMVYKSPYCGCCGGWVKHMEESGFRVKVENSDEMGVIKSRLGVPETMNSCHTAVIDGYVIEGHVPASDVRKLLKERPAVDGLAAPGMPMGSPGMEVEGEAPDAYDVLTFTKEGKTGLFSRH